MLQCCTQGKQLVNAQFETQSGSRTSYLKGCWDTPVNGNKNSIVFTSLTSSLQKTSSVLTIHRLDVEFESGLAGVLGAKIGTRYNRGIIEKQLYSLLCVLSH